MEIRSRDSFVTPLMNEENRAKGQVFHCFIMRPRLMTMSPLYPCGKPCSRGTHHETVKNLALISSIINGIRKESRLRISIPWECFQFFNRIENLHTSHLHHIYTLINIGCFGSRLNSKRLANADKRNSLNQ